MSDLSISETLSGSATRERAALRGRRGGARLLNLLSTECESYCLLGNYDSFRGASALDIDFMMGEEILAACLIS